MLLSYNLQAGNYIPVYSPIVTGGGANIVVDMWMTFELNADCTALELDKSDGVAGANWVAADSQSKLNCTSTAATKATLSTVNGSADAGTKGLVIDLSGSAGSYVTFTSPTPHDNVSVGFWWQSPADAGSHFQYFIEIGGELIYFFGGTGIVNWNSGSSGSIAVLQSTWYWVTIKTIRNGTASLALYDTAGVQVGSTSTKSWANVQTQVFSFGSLFGAGSAGGISYIDNIVMDWTNATFPLGP